MAAVREGRDELVALASDLVAFDTTARNVGDPARQEAELQEYLRKRLAALGAEVDVWEPEPTGTGNRVVPDGLDFVGRPQLAARLRGAGGGRSLLLNGHIDAVSYEPLEQWASHPLRPEVRDGQLLRSRQLRHEGRHRRHAVRARDGHPAGREARRRRRLLHQHRRGVERRRHLRVRRARRARRRRPLRRAHGLRRLGGLPRRREPVVRTLGRTGHAEMHHPHWREGGPVNAIDKMELVLASLRALREDWASRPELDHPYLHRAARDPHCDQGRRVDGHLPLVLRGPALVVYMPGQVNGDRGGQDVFDEVEAWVRQATDRDDWLAEHPPEWEWPCDIVPAEVPDDDPIVADTLAAGAAVGRPGRIGGLDSWHDAAVFTRVAGTPTVSFGPGDLTKAHTIDESVPVPDLVDHAAAVALMLLRWCGVRGRSGGRLRPADGRPGAQSAPRYASRTCGSRSSTDASSASVTRPVSST